MPSTSPTHISDISGPSGNNAANLRDLWEQALISLSSEDQKQFGEPSSSMIDVLKGVQEATESKKRDCISKGWKLYQNKKGEEVKLRHVLEKISTWVKAIIKVVDVGVSADQSGHAALPWAIVKYLTIIAFSDIDEFSNVAEGIETITSLIARYTIVEKLYLQQDCEAQEGLQEAITKLYAAVLTYLAKVKAYVSKNTLKKFGRSLIDTIRKQYDELRTKISEVEVERWIKLVDTESKYTVFTVMADLTYHSIVQLASREEATADIRVLRDVMSGLNRPIMQMSDQMSMFQDKFNRDERIKVFRWMSTIDYRSHHDDLSKDVLARSGQWLLNSQHFVEWGQSSVSSILWLHGIPGSGKTRLVTQRSSCTFGNTARADLRACIRSTVINTLLNEDPDANTSSTAFFYCARSTAEPERAKPAEIMGALLKQLAGSKTDLPIKIPVANEYEKRRKKAEQDCSMLKKLTVQDCTRLIIELTKDQPTTIILDALDECEETTRHELLEAFDEIICHSTEVVKVLVSSRDDIDIKLHLENSKNISVSADNNSSDIARFVKSNVDLLVSQRLLKGRVSPEFKCKIIETLTNGAQGMFRWVEMSLERLKQIKFLPDFKEALGQLPSKLAGLYDIIHSQIEETEHYGKKVAIRTLNWLLCAQRLLSAEELIAAVYIFDDDTSSYSDEDPEFRSEASPKDDILQLCRNFVVYDSEQNIFRFAHQSVREYLMNLSRYTILEQHALAAERCLEIYLTKSLQDFTTRQQKRQNATLKVYAEVYWPVHYKYAENSTSVELKNKFLRFTGQTQGTSSPYVEWRSDILQKYGGGRSWMIDRHHADDHLGHSILLAASHPDILLGLASAFGFSSYLEALRSCLTEVNESLVIFDKTHTLLSLAASEGHNHVVQLLLDNGADVNALNGLALQEAAVRGHTQVLETLLDQESIDTDDLPQLLMRDLPCACSSGNISTVRLLLERGADVNPQNKYCGQALFKAAKYGHDSIVQLLLDHGADINASGDHGTALQEACYGGQDSIVQILLDHGAKESGSGGDSALQAASNGDCHSIMQMLLDHGADVNVSGEGMSKALLLASIRGNRSTVQLLLDHGADINASGEYGTALQRASLNGRDWIVQQLLDHGADVNARGKYSTALQMALDGGYDYIVQTLLDRGADVNGAYEDALRVRSIAGRISIPSRIKHLDDAFGFFEF